MATTRTRPTYSPQSTPAPPNRSGGGRGGSSSGGSGGGSNGRGRSPKRKRRNPFLRLIGGLFWTGFWIVVLAATTGAAYIYYTARHMPEGVAEIENYKPSGRTVIYSADGVMLASIFQENRQPVGIDKIPLDLQRATVAIEDERFYQNKAGFDIRGIGRSVWADVHGGEASQGGSTLTQQLVRNLGIGGLTREKTFSRKIKEIIYADQIARNYSKQQILEMYLNAVYYGSGAYGVQAAAETYFGKRVDQLDLAQCAMIAGLPQRPNGLSPYVNKDGATARRNDVLIHMLQQRYITPDQYNSALAEPIVLAFPKPPNETSKTYHAGYFVDYVIAYLKQHYGSDFIYQGGIRVYTTLNWQMEQQAESIAANQVHNLASDNVSQAAILCMEPQTGYIKAMVGGIDYTQSQYNITTSPRQPGSSFKPVYYTAALDSGIINETTLVPDEPISLPGAGGKLWHPKNDNGRYYGPVTAKFAIAQSLNCASVHVLEKVGIPTAIRYARMMGIHSPLAPYMPLALGASGVSPLEMADVYATIANGGLRPFPTPIEQITDDTGNVVEDNVPQLETTGISANACAKMSDMLQAVTAYGGTAGPVLGDGSVPGAHGKTGTTQEHKDTWFDGYTKDLVTVVWAGHPNYNPKTHRSSYGEPMARNAWGVTVSVPMWRQFMIAAEGIEATAKAREAKLHPPKKAQIVPAGKATDDTIINVDGNANNSGSDNGYGYGYNRRHHDSSQNSDDTSYGNDSGVGSAGSTSGSGDDSGAASSSGGASPPAASDQSGADGDTSGTVSTPAPPTDSDSGSSSGSQNSPAGGDNDGSAPSNAAPPAPAAAPAQPQQQTDDQQGYRQGSLPPASDRSTFDRHTRLDDAVYSPAAKRVAARTVTVTICSDSGLLATKWCPETVTETFAAGSQPHRRCTLHHAPSGE